MQANKALQVFVGSVLAMLGTAAIADATWNLPNCTTGQGAVFGNSYSCASTAPSGGTPTATATAWASDGTGGTFRTAYLSPQGASGFGVANQTEGISITSPNHAMDNSPTSSTELMSFRFSASVALNSVTLGWVSTDRDLSVLAYTGPGVMPASVSGRTVTDLVNNGWSLVSQSSLYADVANPTTTTYSFNTVSPISSSWWLVSAYNGGYDGNTANNPTDSYSDYVKVMKVAGTVVPPPPGVPEPGSMALLGIGLLGLLRASRKNKQ